MEEMLFQFLAVYGWQITLIACSGVIIIGLLKAFKVFDKIEKEKRKYIYAVISTTFSIVASAIYLYIVRKFDPSVFGLIAAGIYGINQTIYSIYETFGFKQLVKKICDFFIKIISNKGKAKQEEQEEKIINVDKID